MKTKPRQKTSQERDTRDSMRELLSSHDFTSPEAAILMAIHLRMGHDGSGWVSQKNIMAFTRLGQTSLSNATRELENLEVLEVTRRNQMKGSKPLPNLYRINFEVLGAPTPDEDGAPSRDEDSSTHRKYPSTSKKKKVPSKRKIVVKKTPLRNSSKKHVRAPSRDEDARPSPNEGREIQGCKEHKIFNPDCHKCDMIDERKDR